MIVVSDTSPINYLILTRYIGVLPDLYGQIFIPETVFNELSSARAPEIVRTWSAKLPSWMNVKVVSSDDPELKLSGGERDAVLIAGEMSADLLLMDERTGRREAVKRNLSVAGTLGILWAAAERGFIDKEESIERLLTTSFRVSPKVLRAFTSKT